MPRLKKISKKTLDWTRVSSDNKRTWKFPRPRPTRRFTMQRKCAWFFLSFFLQINLILANSTGHRGLFRTFQDAQRHAAHYAANNPKAFVYIWKIPSGLKMRNKHDLIGIPVGREGRANVQIYHSLPHNVYYEFKGGIPQKFDNNNGNNHPPTIRTWWFSFQPSQPRFAVIALKGTLQHLSFGEYGDQNHYLDGNGQYFDLRPYLLAVESVGDLGYTSWKNAFAGCTNLRYVKGSSQQARVTENVTNMSGAFFNTPSLELVGFNAQYGNEIHWPWETGKVTDMSRMFESAGIERRSAIPLDVFYLKTARVANMSRMFFRSRFAISGSEMIDMRRVTNMSLMFRSAPHMRPDVSRWDVSKVVDMSYAFGSKHNIINQIGNWDTRNVKHMGGNFSYVRFPEGYVFPLDTSSMETADYLFSDAVNPPIAGIETGKLKRAIGMYENAVLSGNARAFASWQLGNVKNVSKFFKNARWANQPNPLPQRHTRAYYILPYSKTFMRALYDGGAKNVKMSGHAVACQGPRRGPRNQPLWMDTGCINLLNALTLARNFQL